MNFSERDLFLKNNRHFIDTDKFKELLSSKPEKSRVLEILQKSLCLKSIDLEDMAILINVTDEELLQEMYHTAKLVKEKVYGPRIVIFAPLYVSNLCTNNCLYCGFRKDNHISRKILSDEELILEIKALEKNGHKRLVMVYGEHPDSDVNYMAHTIRLAYKNGDIRRVNVNAAPLDMNGYKILRDVGIGTFQVFQETYHPNRYQEVHTHGIKQDYTWRLYAQHRGMAAGLDDVAIGALFGLYDWRFELLGLLAHAKDLESFFDGVGPHTISFPRVKDAAFTNFMKNNKYLVDDKTLEKIVTILRLSVPYTGLIVTARESVDMRNILFNRGISQIDAGTNIALSGYSDKNNTTLENQQFALSDNRSLPEIIEFLTDKGIITSFCTADYRLGRTGLAFMKCAKCGDIQHFCTPNAILTYYEYLLDFASTELLAKGKSLIAKELSKLDESTRNRVLGFIAEMDIGKRDLFI